MIQLKPCPFCGCSVHMDKIQHRWCACHDNILDIEWCPIQVVDMEEWADPKYLDKAIAKWNRRVGE